MRVKLVVNCFADGALIISPLDYNHTDLDLVFTTGAMEMSDPLYAKQLMFLVKISELVNSQGGIEIE